MFDGLDGAQPGAVCQVDGGGCWERGKGALSFMLECCEFPALVSALGGCLFVEDKIGLWAEALGWAAMYSR